MEYLSFMSQQAANVFERVQLNIDPHDEFDWVKLNVDSSL